MTKTSYFISKALLYAGALLLALGLISAPAFAKKESKKKGASPITWEQCCEKNDGDTTKCQKMKNVSGKKEKKGKKWMAKSCPKPVIDEEPAQDDTATDDGAEFESMDEDQSSLDE